VYWLKPDGEAWTPEDPACRALLQGAVGVAQKPSGAAWKLKPIRVGLVDIYGGLAPSGWTRLLLEQFEFPFEVVFPQSLDTGNLNSRFDVLVFPDGAFRRGAPGPAQPNAATIPETFRLMLGRITEDRTVPQLKTFVQAGGSVVAIGSSNALAELLGVRVEIDKALPREKFYIPGALLKAHIDNTNPIAYGMPAEAYVFFDNSPVFRVSTNGVARVGWYEGKAPLASGWAWGQELLDGGAAFAEASVGDGKVILLGPEVAFRAQPHGTFKLLFNALYYGSAKPVTLP